MYKYGNFKKYLLIFCLPFCLFCTGNAQTIKQIKRQINFRNVSHVKDKLQFGLSGGYVNNGFNAGAFFGKYLTKSWLFRNDFTYESVGIGATSFKGYYVTPEFNYTIDKVSNQFFIDAKAGLVLGYETLTNKIMVNKNLDKVVFGEKIGIKFEYYFTPEMCINLDLEQRFIHNSDFGSLSRSVLISISYNY